MGNAPSSFETTRKQEHNYDSSLSWQDNVDSPPPYSPRVEDDFPYLPPPVPSHDTPYGYVTSMNTFQYSCRYSLPHLHRDASSASGSLSDLLLTNSQTIGGGTEGLLSPNYISRNTLTRSNSVTARTINMRNRPSSPSPSIASTQSERAVSVRMDSGRYQASPNDKEDAFLLLQKFDTIVVLDDSASMKGLLWREARDALAGIADKAARYGTNGIDLHFLNSPVVGVNLKSSQEVKQIFQKVVPKGITPTGEKLEELLLVYLDKLENKTPRPKPVNFIILTDGAPTDDPEAVIIAAAKRLDKLHAPLSQVGIQFVQLGSCKQATITLKEMDDELSKKHNIRDMVDTTLYSGRKVTTELLGKILLGGVNRRVDTKGFGCLV